MVAKVEDMTGLPDWPLLLSAAQAARYLGISTTLFRREIAPAISAHHIGKRRLYPRWALDDRYGPRDDVNEWLAD